MRSLFLPKRKPEITRISALPKNKDRSQNTAYTHQKKCYNPNLYGGAEILVIFGLHVGTKQWPQKFILNLTDL